MDNSSHNTPTSNLPMLQPFLALLKDFSNHKATPSKIGSQTLLMKAKKDRIVRNLGSQIVKLSPKQS
jgi:hypothetical protein